ncbi:MAG: low specificity L-threonine aldolase [Gammaproteobacteria bacterium]|nr:low specificity L-threonine aldolase [Gammaproteobacteria bacterium]MDE2251200.1 low specificity L-threonine aldolase [Gammaproteobacteria bacterium]
MSQSRRSFASDNVAPAAPEVMAALARVNQGTVHSYGDDPETRRLTGLAQRTFEAELAIYPVATGTAANALALAVLAPPYGGIYCDAVAHVNTDECGAPEFYAGGAKLLPLTTADGRLRASQLAAPIAHAREMGVHHVAPAALSLSQATEWGTVYGLQQLRELTAAAHAHGLSVHMDGARFANAVAHLGCTPAEASWRSGVDVLSFGATKNGALAAEAVIFFRADMARDFELRRKRAGQLWSKLRYMSAQLTALLEDGLWLRHGRHANALAARLAQGLQVRGIGLVQPVEANEVFAVLPAQRIAALRAAGFEFYEWPAARPDRQPVVRLVTAYDMVAADVDALLAALDA